LFITDEECQFGWQRRIELTLVVNDKNASVSQQLSPQWNPSSLAPAIDVRVLSDTTDIRSGRRHIQLALKSTSAFNPHFLRGSAHASLTIALGQKERLPLQIPVWLGRNSFYSIAPK
jgi:hypothetical protein